MSPGKRKQIDPLEQAIEAALSPGSLISYNAAWSFVDDVQDVANDIGSWGMKKRKYDSPPLPSHRKQPDL